MTKLCGLSALVSPRVATGVGVILLTSLLGGTGCGLSYSLTGIYVEPGTGLTCLVPGVMAQFYAYGTYTEGGHTTETKDLTDSVTWATTIPAVATINTSGVVTGEGGGTTPIVATTQGEFGNLTNYSSVEVMPGGCNVTSSLRPALKVIPGSQAMTTGDKERPLAIAFNSDNGKATDETSTVTWTSSDVKVATVDATGLITAVGAGDATITATGKTANGEVVSATQTVHFTANN